MQRTGSEIVRALVPKLFSHGKNKVTSALAALMNPEILVSMNWSTCEREERFTPTTNSLLIL